ncbi:MAG: hypothetical protein FVQ82_01490 [Planctomycetes bacterium]|nr:hypothetical protein [Planctomycetota bacterium]
MAKKARKEQLNILYADKKWLDNNQFTVIGDYLKEVTINILGLGGFTIETPNETIMYLTNKIGEKCNIQEYSPMMTIEKYTEGQPDNIYWISFENGTKFILETEYNLGKVGYKIDNFRFIGFEKSDDENNNKIIKPVIIAKTGCEMESARMPIGIPGLAELLFPDPENRGFEKPTEGNVVPRIVLVKGAMGTGKTTLATQMMVQMAKANINCEYWCSNEEKKAIENTATSFKFCQEKDLKTMPIYIESIGKDYEKIVTEGPKQDTFFSSFFDLINNKLNNNTQVLFLDSLNMSQATHLNRQELWKIFKKYKDKKTLLSIFLLEDYGTDGSEKVRQLISDCEFLADVVIEMGEKSRHGYQTKSIKVKKRHYGKQVYGDHFYKICPADNPMPSFDVNDSTGIVVYPSIHRYLSRARESVKEPRLVNTGVTHLDSIFLGGSAKKQKIEKGCIDSDSCIVISGERGGHKLPLGLNLLMGGMWRIDNKKIVADDDVLLILLDEEADIQIAAAATAINTHLFTGVEIPAELNTLDNGNYIQWHSSNNKHPREKKCPYFNLHEHEELNRGKKVQFHSYCAEIGAKDSQNKDCRKLMVAGFRPGCVTPEEFIYTVDRLLTPSGSNRQRFGRVLFLSTAHLQNRFPLLGSSELFVPALVDLFKSKDVISIFVDVQGRGSDEKLSFGLAALADYIICVNEFSSENQYNVTFPDKLESPKREFYSHSFDKQSSRYVTSMIHVENVRGKEYSRPCHAVTVGPTEDGKGNELFILNARKTEDLPVIFPKVEKPQDTKRKGKKKVAKKKAAKKKK